MPPHDVVSFWALVFCVIASFLFPCGLGNGNKNDTSNQPVNELRGSTKNKIGGGQNEQDGEENEQMYGSGQGSEEIEQGSGETTECDQPILLNGKIVGSFSERYRDGDGVIFKCNGGFFLQGNQEAICQPNGNWTSLPNCTVSNSTCSRPILKNSMVKSGKRKEYKINEQVTVACMPSYYIMQGSPLITCLGLSNWSGAPRCMESTKIAGSIFLNISFRAIYSDLKNRTTIEFVETIETWLISIYNKTIADFHNVKVTGLDRGRALVVVDHDIIIKGRKTDSQLHEFVLLSLKRFANGSVVTIENRNVNVIGRPILRYSSQNKTQSEEGNFKIVEEPFFLILPITCGVVGLLIIVIGIVLLCNRAKMKKRKNIQQGQTAPRISLAAPPPPWAPQGQTEVDQGKPDEKTISPETSVCAKGWKTLREKWSPSEEVDHDNSVKVPPPKMGTITEVESTTHAEVTEEPEIPVEMQRGNLVTSTRDDNLEKLLEIVQKARSSRASGQLGAEIKLAERKMDKLKAMKKYTEKVVEKTKEIAQEVKRYHHPPPVLFDIVIAMLLFCGEHEDKTREWRNCQQYFTMHASTDTLWIFERLADIKLKHIHPEIATRILEIIGKHDFMDVAEASRGANVMYLCLRTICEKVVAGVVGTKPAVGERQAQLLSEMTKKI